MPSWSSTPAPQSYYIWKWAADGPCWEPRAVCDSLIQGIMPPAVEAFDPSPLLRCLERGAAAGQAAGEEWEWQVVPSPQPGMAQAVFLSGSIPQDAHSHQVRMARALWTLLLRLHMSIVPETEALWLGPQVKQFLFCSGQGLRVHDVTEKNIRRLLLSLRRSQDDPFAILENRRQDFVQCYLEKNRRYVLEWRQWHKPLYDDSRSAHFSHWRLVDQERQAALPRRLRPGKVEIPEEQDPDLVAFPLVLEAFRAFVQGGTPPRPDHWRLINDEI